MVDASDPSVLYYKQVLDNLYFVILNEKPRRSNGSHMFTFDIDTLYTPYAEDFGPPNMAKIFRFCVLLDRKLEKMEKKKIFFYSDHEPKHRMNAAFLLGAFLILKKNMTPATVYGLFKGLEVKGLVEGFRDAAPGDPTHRLNLADCFNGLYRAKKLRFIDLESFNLRAYEHYEQVENGDFNWILPGKILAMCSPVDETKADNVEDDGERYLSHTPSDYLPYFKANHVMGVVRLNCNEYDRETFIKNGVAHYDMYFEDGTQPPLHIVNKFLDIVEKSNGAIAVHCKAGLGRTGTLNGCYLIKNYGFSAKESIAFMRVQRPGSVIGPQQHFLEQWEVYIRKKQAAVSKVNENEQMTDDIDQEEGENEASFEYSEDEDAMDADESTVTTTDDDKAPAFPKVKTLPTPTAPKSTVPVQPRKYRLFTSGPTTTQSVTAGASSTVPSNRTTSHAPSHAPSNSTVPGHTSGTSTGRTTTSHQEQRPSTKPKSARIAHRQSISTSSPTQHPPKRRVK